MRTLAPAGAPIRVADLARWSAFSASARKAGGALEHEVCTRFGAGHAVLTSTGRAGLTLLLRAMRRLAAPHRDEVILPSYTCYSVAASVVKAGLRPRLVDIAPETLDYAPQELASADYRRVLAVVATNLYGLPNNLPAIARVARAHGAFLIDDAAQAMGASVGGRWSGTWGDGGIFSFDKGKNVSAIDGGVVVAGSGLLAGTVAEELAGQTSTGEAESAVHLVKALAYFVLLRPWLYGIPARMPQLGLGKTIFTTDFPLSRPDSLLTALALTMMHRLDEFTSARVCNAHALAAGLSMLPSFRPAVLVSGASPVYLRFPVVCATAELRDAALSALAHAGGGASASYPESLIDVPELQPHLANPGAMADGGRFVARRILTLPTHPFVRAGDIEAIVDTLERATATAHAAKRVVRHPSAVRKGASAAQP
jgi:perosamine synthetase